VIWLFAFLNSNLVQNVTSCTYFKNMREKKMKPLACAILLFCVFGAQAQAATLTHGKYGCVSSKFKAASGTYEFSPRGAFTVSANGEYSYLGFEKPSNGKFIFDQKSGKISFSGGYLDKGEATPIKGDSNRFYLVTPTLPEHRWTCGLK
jgi:hypothetical protein